MVNSSVIGAVTLIAVRTFGASMFLYAYSKSKRKSALFLALTHVAGIFEVTSDLAGMSVENFFIALAFALTSAGLFYLIWEDSPRPFMKGLYRAAFLLLLILGVADSILEKDLPWDIYYLGGFLIMMLGILGMEMLSRNYGRDGKMLGIFVSLSGLLSIIYPLPYQYGLTEHELLPSVQIVAIVLGIGSLYFYYQVIFSPRFLRGYDVKNIEIPELEGVQIISPEDFKNIKTQLENVPVLAFLRTLKPPESGKSFFFTIVDGMGTSNAIRPTDLYKVVETVNRYITEAKRSNVKGIVLIEGIEYLRIHNEFPSIAKMLSTVRDYVLANNGALIVVIDKNALDEREYMLLRRLLE